jgi:Tfp pilus assembly protein PilF
MIENSNLSIFINLGHKFFRYLLISWLATGCLTLQKEDNSDQVEKLINTKLDLIYTQLDKRQPKKALENIRPIIRKFPDHPKLLNAFGLVHLSLLNIPQAVRAFQKAYALTSTTTIGLNLSSALIADNQPVTAQTLLLKLLQDETYEFRERIHHNLGLAFQKTKNFKKAEISFKRALEENPIYYLTTFQLAKLYLEIGKTKNAIQYFELAIANCPTCFDPIDELVKFHLSNNQYGLATSTVKKFLTKKKLPIDEKQRATTLLTTLSGSN